MTPYYPWGQGQHLNLAFKTLYGLAPYLNATPRVYTSPQMLCIHYTRAFTQPVPSASTSFPFSSQPTPLPPGPCYALCFPLTTSWTL